MKDNKHEQSLETPIRVFLVDDHPLVRRGLSALLEAEPDVEVIGEADSIMQASDELDRVRPNVVLIDLNLGHESGFDLLHHIQNKWVGVRTIVVSMHSPQLYAEKAIATGASGYVRKDQASEKIVDAIRTVQQGYEFF